MNKETEEIAENNNTVEMLILRSEWCCNSRHVATRNVTSRHSDCDGL